MASDALKAALGFLVPAKPEEAKPAEAHTSRRPIDAQLEMLLVRKVLSGDRRAFTQMVRMYQDFIFDLTFRLLGDESEAEDVAQEVFSAVYRNLATFKGESRLSTWMFRIAKNHCLNRLKYLGRRERGRRVPIDDVPEGVLELPGGPKAPDRALQDREEQQLVEEALETLDEEHRLLVVLRDVEGMSYEEIAAVTEQPEGTVKSRLHRARAQLAEAVARLQEDEVV